MDIPESHARSDDHHINIPTEPIMPQVHHSSRILQPSTGILQSREYQQHEDMGRHKGKDMGCHKGKEWTTNPRQTQARISINSLSDVQDNYAACLTETKASHKIPHSYRHAM